MRELVVQAQVHDLSLARRKGLQELADPGDGFLARQGLSDFLARVRESGIVAGHFPPTAVLPAMSPHQVECDRQEPGAESFGLPDAVQAFEGSEPGLLEDVTNVFEVVELPAQGSPDRFGMTANEVMQALSVPRTNPGEEVAIARVQGREFRDSSAVDARRDSA